MKILILQGSPRKNGNTDIVLDALTAGAEAQGAKVERVRLARQRIAGCIECFACQKRTDRLACAIKDDGPKVIGRMLRADVVVVATPVFCWGPTAQLKALLDRLYCTFKFRTDPYKSLLEGKSVATVVTAGGPRSDGAASTSRGVRILVDAARAVWRGELLALDLKEPADTAADKRLLARAERFGRKLAAEA